MPLEVSVINQSDGFSLCLGTACTLQVTEARFLTGCPQAFLLEEM